MTAPIVNMAAALATQLAAASFDEAVTVERTYRVSKSMTSFRDGQKPLLSVVPAINRTTRLDQDSSVPWFVVDIGIRSRAKDTDRQDELCDLTLEIQEWIDESFAPPAGNWPLGEAVLDPLFHQETLEVHQVWFGVIRCGFGVRPNDAD